MRPSAGHKRRRETTVRMAHHNQVTPVTDRVDHRVGVVEQARSSIVTRQIRCHHIVTSPGECVTVYMVANTFAPRGALDG